MILAAGGIAPAAPRVVTGPTVGKAFNEELFAAVGLHRAWERAQMS
jgi:catalase